MLITSNFEVDLLGRERAGKAEAQQTADQANEQRESSNCIWLLHTFRGWEGKICLAGQLRTGRASGSYYEIGAPRYEQLESAGGLMGLKGHLDAIAGVRFNAFKDHLLRGNLDEPGAVAPPGRYLLKMARYACIVH